ncbi:6207_t:CDS:2 [Funneliformis mosseae]|uniref:6207_t:CDS:1 n=1 Tax=Funneliformis mosseae TaxID=27381 RepID=A0A9N9CN20_FUNMO|nr:6207_t:CDS:2 [Funneliformis mosseae]
MDYSKDLIKSLNNAKKYSHWIENLNNPENKHTSTSTPPPVIDRISNQSFEIPLTLSPILEQIHKL